MQSTDDGVSAQVVLLSSGMSRKTTVILLRRVRRPSLVVIAYSLQAETPLFDLLYSKPKIEPGLNFWPDLEIFDLVTRPGQYDVVVVQSTLIRGLTATWTIFHHCLLSSADLSIQCPFSPVHSMMLSCQLVFGLPLRLWPETRLALLFLRAATSRLRFGARRYLLVPARSRSLLW